MIRSGVRRLKQSLRHLLDIFLPSGVEPSADGWKLTVRIRTLYAEGPGASRPVVEGMGA